MRALKTIRTLRSRKRMRTLRTSRTLRPRIKMYGRGQSDTMSQFMVIQIKEELTGSIMTLVGHLGH